MPTPSHPKRGLPAADAARLEAGMRDFDELESHVRSLRPAENTVADWSPAMSLLSARQLSPAQDVAGQKIDMPPAAFFQEAAENAFIADDARFVKQSFKRAGADIAAFKPHSLLLSFLNSSRSSAVFRAHALFGNERKGFAITISCRPDADELQQPGLLERQFQSLRFYYFDLPAPNSSLLAAPTEVRPRAGRPPELVEPLYECYASTSRGPVYMFSTALLDHADELNRFGRNFCLNSPTGQHLLSAAAGQHVEGELVRIISHMYASTMICGCGFVPFFNLNVGPFVISSADSERPRVWVTAASRTEPLIPAALIDSLLSPTCRTHDGRFEGVLFWPEASRDSCRRFFEALKAGFAPIYGSESSEIARACIRDYVRRQADEFTAGSRWLEQRCFGTFSRSARPAHYLHSNPAFVSVASDLIEDAARGDLRRDSFSLCLQQLRDTLVPVEFIDTLRGFC